MDNVRSFRIITVFYERIIPTIIIFYSFSIPFITKVGVEKSRYMVDAIYVIPFIVGTGIFKLLKERYPDPPEILVDMGMFLVRNIYILVPIIVLASLWISYRISVKIYRKKEF